MQLSFAPTFVTLAMTGLVWFGGMLAQQPPPQPTPPSPTPAKVDPKPVKPKKVAEPREAAGIAAKIVPPSKLHRITLTATPSIPLDIDSYEWTIDPPTDIVYVEKGEDGKDGETANRIIVEVPPGDYKTSRRWKPKNGVQKVSRGTFSIAAPDPKPDDPKPVDPVKPPPGPNPGIIPTADFRVLVVWESSGPITPEQANVLNSIAVANYLDSKCAGGKAGWRRYEMSVTQGQTELQFWRDAWGPTKDVLLKDPAQTVPGYVIFNGKSATAFPLPKSEAEAMEFLKKFGG